jgi:hypothetical protein
MHPRWAWAFARSRTRVNGQDAAAARAPSATDLREPTRVGLERFPLQVNRKALWLFDFVALSAENRFPLFRKML